MANVIHCSCMINIMSKFDAFYYMKFNQRTFCTVISVNFPFKPNDSAKFWLKPAEIIFPVSVCIKQGQYFWFKPNCYLLTKTL